MNQQTLPTNSKLVNCPICGQLNNDNWPIKTMLPDGKEGPIEWGGCQECWEAQVDTDWWAELELIAGVLHPCPACEELTAEDWLVINRLGELEQGGCHDCFYKTWWVTNVVSSTSESESEEHTDAS